MKPKSNLFLRSLPLLSAVMMAFPATHASADTFTWTQTAGGTQSWDVGANWFVGTAPTPASGDTVDFSTVNIAVNTTLNLHSDRTATTWKFGDLAGGQTWTVNAGTPGGKLILAGTTPAISVGSGITTTVNAIVDGTDGLIKEGAGTLTLRGSGGHTVTGGITAKDGTLALNLSDLATPTDLITNTNSLTLHRATFSVTGKNAVSAQTLGNPTLNSGSSVISLLANSGANTLNLTLGNTWTRNAGSAVNIQLNTGSTLTSGPTLTSDIVGPWASVGTGSSTRYATVSGGNIASLTGTAAANASNLTDTTGAVNYDLTVATGATPAEVSANTIRYAAGAAATAPGATSFSVNGLMNAGSGLWTIGTNPITIGANKDLVVNTANNNITISSIIQNNAGGASSLTKTGGSTLTLSGANNFTGGVTLNTGTLNLGNNSALGGTAGTFTINGGTLNDNGNPGFTSSTNNPIVLNASFSKSDNVGRAFNLGTGAVTLNTPITISLTHTLEFGGTVTGPGGLNALDITPSGSNNAQVILGAAVTLRNTQTVNTLGSAGRLVLNGVLSDDDNDYGFIVNGNGSTGGVTLGNVTHTFTGPVTLQNSGGLTVLGNVTPSSITIGAGSTLQIGDGDNGNTGSLGSTTPIINNGTFRLGRNNLVQGTHFGVISGTGGLTKGTHGVTLLNAANSFAGPIVLSGNSGGIQFTTIKNVGGGVSALGAPTTVAGGTITLANRSAEYTGSGDTTDRVFALTDAGQILASGTTTSGSPFEITSNIAPSGANRTLTLSGTGYGKWAGMIANNGTQVLTLTKSGTGTWLLGGANTFTGTTTISGGKIALGNALALQNSAYVTTGSTGAIGLDVNGVVAPTIGGLSGAVNLATAVTGYNTVTGLTLNVLGTNSVTYSGAIAEGDTGMTLTKTGTGTQILSGTNGYTGDTAVSNGLLRINGSLASDSDVTVSAGYVGGTGTINGSVALNSNGGIDLRDGAIGTLTIGGDLALNGTAGANKLFFDLGTGGTTDKIVVGGDVIMPNAGAGVISFNQLSGGRVTAGSYNLIQATGTMPDLSNFSLVTTAAFGSSFTLGVSGTNLQVTTTQLPAGPAAAFWSGASGTNWSTVGNWNTTVADNIGTGAAPSYQSNVTFSTTTPVAANLTNTLDADFDINSLRFNSTSGGVTINGTKTLTIEATNANGNTAGQGIIANTQTSGTNTINANLGIAANQSWIIGLSNAIGGTLTVGGNVTDYGGNRILTKLGGGTLNLNGNTTVGSLHAGYAVSGGNSPNTNQGLITVGSGKTLSVGYGPSSNLYVAYGTGNGNGGRATVDASAATSVILDVNRVEVGATCGSQGLLMLGADNTITAYTDFGINFGAWGFDNAYGAVTTPADSDTTIHTPIMHVGYNLPNGTTGGSGRFLLGSGASFTLGGINDGRTALNIGVISSGNGASEVSPSNMDLYGAGTGVADLKLSSLLIGQKLSGSGSTVHGHLNLSPSADNHLDISGGGTVVTVGDNTGSGGTVTGTLTIGNLDSTSSITSADNSTAILLARKTNTGTPVGNLNLNGGTLTIATTGAAIAGGGGTSNVRFNGTTLKAGASSTTFITDVTNALVHPGGVGFDTNSNSITVPQALVTPTGGGYGLAMTTLTPTNGGSGYTRLPHVTFSTPGGGTAATGYATINTAGQVTGIVITSPGSGYTNGGTATITLSGSNGTGATFTNPTATVLQTGGGLTKSGAGTLTLGGANTYTGATLVSGGTLALGATASLNTSEIELEAGTSFDTTAQSYVMPAAKPFTLHLNSAGAGSSGKITAASLDITNADVVVVIDDDIALDDPVYVLAEYTSLTGAEFDSITAPPTGYLIDYNYNSENKIAWVQEAGGDDYADWDDEYAADLSDKNGDEDGDGLSNFQEYAFGLDPTSGASVNPITDISDLKTLGQFTYTRRVGTGLDYTIWTSTTLLANEWDEDTTADQEAGAPVDGVETVLVTLSEIPTSDKLFIRVKAN